MKYMTTGSIGIYPIIIVLLVMVLARRSELERGGGGKQIHNSRIHNRYVHLYLLEGHFTHETESPWPAHFKHSRSPQGEWHTTSESLGPSLLHATLEGPIKHVNARWMEGLHGFLHGIKWISFMVAWTIFKDHLLEVGLTQNQEIIAFQMLTIVDLFYFITCAGGPHEWTFIEIAFGWGPRHIWLRTTLEGPWPHYIHGFGGTLGRSLDNFFWALTISRSRPLALVGSGPNCALCKEGVDHSYNFTCSVSFPLSGFQTM